MNRTLRARQKPKIADIQYALGLCEALHMSTYGPYASDRLGCMDNDIKYYDD